MGCCDLTNLVFAEVEFTAHRCAVFIGCNGVYDLALLISDSAVLRDNILCGDDLIDRTGKATLFILRLIDGGQFVSAFIYAADDGNAEEHLADFFHGDGAFLCHIGLIHFYYRNPAFFCGIILRDIEVHGRFVEDIAVGSLHLDNRVPLSKGQLFRRDKRTFCIGVEHINGGGRRVSEGHCYGVAIRVINLKSRTGVRNGLSGFCVLFHDFDEAVKGCVVDKIAIGSPILRNEHIKVGHQLAAFPARNLMDGVDAVRHILGLGKAVFITGEIITLGVLGNLVAACGFQVHGKLCAAFGRFNLRITVIGVLNDGNIALCDLLGHIICRLIMLHGIKLRLCTDLMDGGIKQITLRGSDFSHRPVVIADIFFGNELPVFVGGVGIHKGFALIDAVNSTGKRSITLRRADFSVALSNGHRKLLQNIEEAAVRDLVPVDRRRLRFGNNIANGSVHFLHGIRCGTGNENIFKGRHAVCIGYGILVHGNAGERSTIQMEGYAFVEIVLRGLDNLQISSLELVAEVYGRNLTGNHRNTAGLLRLIPVVIHFSHGVNTGHQVIDLNFSLGVGLDCLIDAVAGDGKGEVIYLAVLRGLDDLGGAVGHLQVKKRLHGVHNSGCVSDRILHGSVRPIVTVAPYDNALANIVLAGGDGHRFRRCSLSGNGQRVTIGRKDNIGQVAAEGIVRYHMIAVG